LRADPAGSLCGIRVNAIEAPLLAGSRRHAWQSATGMMPSALLRLSVRRAQLSHSDSPIHFPLLIQHRSEF